MIDEPRAGRGLARAALIACLLGLLVMRGAPPAASSSRIAGLQLFVMPQAHLSPVLQLIRGARRSLHLEVYLLTDRSIVQELKRARQRGVEVRVLLEEHPFNGARYARLGYSLLQQAGVAVRWANEETFRYTHEKALAVDGRQAGIFTFNLTSSGLRRNREFGLVDTIAGDVRALEAIFDADWARHQPAYRGSTHLVVSPYNARRVLAGLIEGAQHTLDVYAEEVNDTSIEALLGQAERRGVRVRLITSQVGSGVDTLRRSGVAVKLVKRPYIHAKAVVGDGTTVFVGSENLSSTSLDRNREMGVVVRDPGLASGVENVFALDWRGAPSIAPSRTPAPSGDRPLFVRVSTSPATVRRGDLLTIRASTIPGAACAVRVTYPDGYVSRARSLSRVRTAPTGTVGWSLRVGSRVSGTGEARVACSAAGAQASSVAAFTIE